ncbi:MAG: DUF6351 family protein [Burkholderiaceae bacterium]
MERDLECTRVRRMAHPASSIRALIMATVTAVILAACGHDDGATTSGSFDVRTLSSSPDRVTGGEALVEVRYPDSLSPDDVRVSLNGVDVTAQLSTRDATARTLSGVVTGLTTDPSSTAGSRNALVVTSTVPSTNLRSDVVLTNYPITGPVLSGPHIAPYECRTVENGLGAPLDADCSATTQVTYFYRASNHTFKPLANPTGTRPADLVTTTTNAGVTVPYIVRVESGTINRGVYRLAVLDDPVAGATKYVPSAGWNRKLIVSFDCCGSAQYNQGVHAIGTILSDRELSRGFAFFNSTELWNNQHANPHLQGETLMMMKEYFIKHVGVPKWTIGVGGSGGAIQQYLIAQLFPGLLDGLQPNVSFPETLMPEIMECRLLNNVYASDRTRWTTAKQTAINGFNNGTCQLWDAAFSSIIKSDNAPGCGVTQPANVANIYNRTSNPNGLRCDFFQTNVNLLGVTPGTNKARRPIDNIGIQYGLAALNAGTITVPDFLDVNAAVGGFDNDGIPQAARTAADLDALRLTYEGGFKNSFSGPGLANIPIITQRANADEVGDIHDPLQDLIIRARLQRANGRTDNQIIFASGLTSGFDIGIPSLDTITVWLDAIVADPAPASIDKVARLKPSTATDACWDPSGVRINEPASTDPSTRCNRLYPRFSTPHIVAGGPLTNDIMKCQLKPVTASDYTVAFTAAQLAQLNSIFATGVCDWSKAGVNQNPLRGTYLKLPLS